MRHVITLSTIPPRFGQIGPALASMLRQKARPEAVELYIPASYRRFPDWGGGLPEVPEGVRIVRTDRDLGPATKILPAARAWRGQAVELIYIDDDRILAPDWTRRCLEVRRLQPAAAICGAGFDITLHYGIDGGPRPQPQAVRAPDPWHRFDFQLRRFGATMRRRLGGPQWRRPLWPRFEQSGHIDIAEGYGGVMVQPDFFDDACFEIPPVVWAVDDIWLSGTLARRGIPIWADKSLYQTSEILESSLNHALYQSVIEGANRDQANLACIDYMRRTYGIWGGVAVQST